MIHLERALLAGLSEAAPSPAAVMASLQSALELEHATIPVYLYALYSLDPAKNAEIRAIIQSVVIEEMLHMVLVSNVLNAFGGAPVIDKPDFTPNFPGPLPGGVQSELTVTLAPFGPDQLEVFLKIEEPEKPLVFEAALRAEKITIGQFYTAIIAAIGTLGDAAFAVPPRNQIGPGLMPEAVEVSDVASAQAALRIIIDQGEGTSVSPLEQVGGGYAHYYRFMQIKQGHALMPTGVVSTDPEDAYAYNGAAIPFDPSGVYPVPAQTFGAYYPPGSPQALLNDNFNYTYTSLLKSLHALCNGTNNAAEFDTTLGLMMSLKGQARAMMAGIPNPELAVGPTFRYQPLNPG